MDRLKQFDTFYEENKKSIQMPKRKNYPFNYKKGKDWAESQCDSESTSFANKIIENTRYISYDDFIISLATLCKSYVETYGTAKHAGSAFILLLPFQVNKSNIWVTLLAYPLLRKLITEIYYDLTDVYNDMHDSRSRIYRKKVRCIVIDDCAYTGHQLTYVSSIDYSRMHYKNKPPQPDVHHVKWLEWYDDMQSGAKKIVSQISIEQFSVDLIVPFMSTLARANLHSIHYVKISSKCVVFPIFRQQINIDKIPHHVLNEFKKTFQFHKDISAIYFDHKIADSVSTFNKVYLLAPLFNCALENRTVPFIDNCDRALIPDGINIYDFHIDVEKTLTGKGETCPPSFYKNIVYTLRGEIIPGSTYMSKVFGEETARTY